MTEETIFTEAIGKSIEERNTFLDEACGGDTELRARLETLLKSHDEAGSFLAKPAEEDLGATMDFSAEDLEGLSARSDA